MTAFRAQILERLHGDLVGPLTPTEVIEGRPTERYVTGILFPQGELLPQEEDDSLPEGEDDEGGSASPGASEGVSLGYTVRPASCALSFAVASEGPPDIEVEVSGGRYEPRWEDGVKHPSAGNAKWHRRAVSATVLSPVLEANRVAVEDLAALGIPGTSLRIRWARSGGSGHILTVALVNERHVERDKLENEKNALFQAQIRVRARGQSRLVERPSRRTGEGDDLKLLYRHALEYAVGHTCSADWTMQADDIVEVRTTWMPSRLNPAVSPNGQASVVGLRTTAFSPDWLADASQSDLEKALTELVDLYEAWLREQRIEADASSSLKAQAQRHLDVCHGIGTRMRRSIRLLCDAKDKGQPARLEAFRLAMKAMALQRTWARGDKLTWFPFQIGFQLVALGSLMHPADSERELMDLLWFPTGGGKTEAYLGLIAFVLFHRRLRHEGDAHIGAGTAVLMRYTLRLLTIQQFQRAARLVCACEHLRRRNPALGTTPFSIGLWVGSGATPNTLVAARKTIDEDANPTPKQLRDCPCCGRELKWSIGKRKGGDKEHVLVRCKHACAIARDDDGYLPIWTIDEDIYAARPSLVIATADKFTQITRKPSQTIKLFGGKENDPPDLILQDELHLISGPLGSLAGIYEMAIDELCTRRNLHGEVTHRAKIIGSTATIRAADEQVTALFARKTQQFPSPELNAELTFFARPATEMERPGRLYVGITSAGRSPKYTLQALYASLLQSAAQIPTTKPDERDPWWTLIGYFNSLRELGGSLVMLSDDVPVSIGIFARARMESVSRQLDNVDELTSRKSQVDLRDTLAALEKIAHPDAAAFDAVLATNMISVGVDVDRLGTMAITNQPKQMAEYIQASSRVGRKYPGIVVTMYNNNRARDRSHYESFQSWHQALYRDVEPTSVTPLAPRARDKALHAALVALVAAQVSGLRTAPKLTAAKRAEVESSIVKRLIVRAQIVDKSELAGVVKDLQRILDRWTKRFDEWTQNATEPVYWQDSDDEKTLLMSAENVAAHSATGRRLKDVFPTLNSLRNVEAASPFALHERIRVAASEEEADAD